MEERVLQMGRAVRGRGDTQIRLTSDNEGGRNGDTVIFQNKWDK